MIKELILKPHGGIQYRNDVVQGVTLQIVLKISSLNS